MAFVTVEDEHGSVECVFFKEPWALSRATLSSEMPVLVVGRLEHGADGTAKVRGESARSLSEVREQQTREVHIVTDDQELREERIEEMMRLVRDSKGRCPVHLHVKRSDKAWVSFQLSKDIRVAADDHLVQSLEGLFGRSDAVRLT
jgi:DNA polymerase-3 subunit alpha